MTLDGFLQILSPYVRADREQDFAEHFMRVISRNLFPPGDILELDDFRMFTDMDLSVRRLPASDIKKVIRSVRDAIGDDLRTDRRNVAYAVQKALSDPTLAYRTEQEAEIIALKKTIAEAEAHHRDIEEVTSQRQSSVEAALDAATRETAALRAESESRAAKLEHELHLVKHGLSEREKEAETQATAAKLKDERHAHEIERHRRHFWLTLATFLWLTAIGVVWLLPSEIFSIIHPYWVIRIGLTTAMAVMLLGHYLRCAVLARLGLAVSIGSLISGLGKLASPPNVSSSGPTPPRSTMPLDGGVPPNSNLSPPTPTP